MTTERITDSRRIKNVQKIKEEDDQYVKVDMQTINKKLSKNTRIYVHVSIVFRFLSLTDSVDLRDF